MGLKDTRKKRRAERAEKRAARADGLSAAERAHARMEARTNGDGAATTALGGDGGNGAGGETPPLTVLPGGGEPPRAKPRLKKLRAALVIAGLSLLALVSWIFGIMMAVAQDLPKLENREQYLAAQNSKVYDRYGE